MNRLLPFAVGLALCAGSASATSYVMMADESLVDGAMVIAQAAVAGVEPAPIAGPPSIDTFFQVEHLLKGYVTGSTIIVRTPGGIGPDGVGLRLWGVPEFREGDRVLLFLAPRSDGTYGILHLMLGAFFEVQSGGQRVAVRALSEAFVLPRADGGRTPAAAEPLRDFAGFVNWIRDRAAGLKRPIDYYVDPARGHLRPALTAGPLLEDPCTQLGYRWFEFDRGESVTWSLEAGSGDPAGVSRRAFLRARRAWSQAESSTISLDHGGSARATEGLTGLDDTNVLQLEDPADLISGTFTCEKGGLLSVTGIWFQNGRGQACERLGTGRKQLFEGREYLEILGADIVTNDGARCLMSDDLEAATRILTHELGHSLGLSHATEPDAVMSGVLTDSESHGPLSESDQEAVRGLYRPTVER